MESPGAFPDGEWDAFGKIFASEELDFTAQFLGQSPFFLEHDEALDPRASSNLFPTSEANVNFTGVTDSLIYSLGNLNSNLHYFSQESSNSSNCSSGIFSANPSHDNFFFGDSKHIPVANDIPMSMNICMMDEKNLGSFFAAFPDIALGEAICINSDMIPNGSGKSDDGQPAAIATAGTELVLKRKFDTPECPVKEEEKLTTRSAENTKKKKPRVSRNVHKPKKNLKSKKNQKLSPNGEEESNAGPDGQSSCSYSSDEDNASQETNGGATSESRDSAALNLSGKTRASRGSATDPQSLYARKRRERINERLRILQNLVPNGTKVDISTMLEEAVHYVKFLQLQIKLLSSDDLWMYAPIAYNGMDIGLNQKIAPPL